MTTFSTQIISDGTKKSVIKCIGNFTAAGADESANNKIIGSLLSGALAVDSNNAILVNNPQNSALNGVARANYNYAISRIVSDVNNCTVTINWGGATPVTAWVAGPGKGDNNIEEQLGSIWNNAIGPNGNVTFTTANTNASSSYSIILEIKKGPNSGNSACDYNMGQIQRPADFNFGVWGVKP